MSRARRGVIEVPTWFALQHVPCVFVAESLISGVEAVGLGMSLWARSIARGDSTRFRGFG